jgi:hypothetical protein
MNTGAFYSQPWNFPASTSLRKRFIAILIVLTFSSSSLSCGDSCSNALDNALYREYADGDCEQRQIEGNYIADNGLSNGCSLRLSAIMPRWSWNSPRPTSASQPTTSTMKAKGIAVAMKMDSIIRYPCYPLFRPARPEVERVFRGIACLPIFLHKAPKDSVFAEFVDQITKPMDIGSH